MPGSGHTKSPKLFRTYMQVHLSENLEANQMYCVSFDISLSDLSKYAVTGIGAYVSDRKETQPNTGIVARDPQVKHRTDKVMQLTEGWETVCGTILGTGTEEYMTIGCFNGSRDLEEVKMKKPSGMAGVQQMQAYYYIDNVSVVPVEAKSQCSCSKSSSTAPDLVYGGPTLPGDMDDDMVVGRTAVYYAFVKRAFTRTARPVSTVWPASSRRVRRGPWRSWGTVITTRCPKARSTRALPTWGASGPNRSSATSCRKGCRTVNCP